MRRVQRWDYSISANEFTTEIWERVYPSGSYERLETGYPRNDVLATRERGDAADARARRSASAPGRCRPLHPDAPRVHRRTCAMLDVDALAEASGRTTSS